MAGLDLFPEGEATLRLVGEIDLMTAPQLDAALVPLVDAGGTVVLDMRGVQFMDSTGIRAIITAERHLKGRGTLVLRDPPPMVVRLLEITGLYPPPEDMALQVELRAPSGDGPGPDGGTGRRDV